MVSVLYPALVVAADELGKGTVGLRLLHPQHLVHVCVGTREFELPEHEVLVHFVPVVDGAAELIIMLMLCEFLLVIALGLLCH
jgi:hypothetical protein